MNITKTLLTASVLASLSLGSSSSFASNKIETFSAISSCNTVVGTTETAGSGGISNGSGGIKATSDLVIISCTLPTTTDRPGVDVYINDGSPAFSYPGFGGPPIKNGGTTVCSLIAYDNFGNVTSSDSDFANNPWSESLNLTLNVKAQQPNSGYYNFACRLSRNDVVYMYKHNPFSEPDNGEF
ncbi:hypothetical protein [Pseudoalteromonas sp. MTN2-4]|uniref:hypothetical protein n=1 Tax=Pseudoalteromonas sp. MTN2-4 TaxID=3056555 RepID=UPI0036F21E1F|tara:strand:+ start:1673 stop:2221 length:549 start_codon:yes stop_codon:yes gene_type:complete